MWRCRFNGVLNRFTALLISLGPLFHPQLLAEPRLLRSRQRRPALRYFITFIGRAVSRNYQGGQPVAGSVPRERHYPFQRYLTVSEVEHCSLTEPRPSGSFISLRNTRIPLEGGHIPRAQGLFKCCNIVERNRIRRRHQRTEPLAEEICAVQSQGAGAQAMEGMFAIMMRGLPVAQRENLIAASMVSAPELQKKTRNRPLPS